VSPATKPFRFETSVSARSGAPAELVYDLVADLSSHLQWLGEEAPDQKFRLLTLEAPGEPATVGTAFVSSGASDNGTFHDSSVVTHASRPALFVFETDARLDRKHGKPWEVHFTHRYDIRPDGTGTRINYTDTIDRVSYVPYWLQPGIRPLTKRLIERADTKNMETLARFAEQRSRSG
jgi:hypothetical protein